MNKKKYSLIYLALSVIMLTNIIVTLATAKRVDHKLKDKMVEASSLTMSCFNKIKEYKIEHGLSKADEDIYDSYMIGPLWGDISTTDGELGAKLSTVNPNFAALYINYFDRAGLKEGDSVAMIFSGSFPCLNIACLCACKVYGLNTYVMASFGASGYGANDPEFTGIDMIHYLHEIPEISISDVDLASFGGYADNPYIYGDLDADVIEPIRDRIINLGIPFYYEEDFSTNIKHRIDLVEENVGEVDLFINVGGTSVGLGLGQSQFEDKWGLITKDSRSFGKRRSEYIGLIDSFINKGIPVLHMLHVKNICTLEGLPYNPSKLPEIGAGDCYYEVSYDLVFPIITLAITLPTLGYVCYRRKKEIKKENETK